MDVSMQRRNWHEIHPISIDKGFYFASIFAPLQKYHTEIRKPSFVVAIFHE